MVCRIDSNTKIAKIYDRFIFEALYNNVICTIYIVCCELFAMQYWHSFGVSMYANYAKAIDRRSSVGRDGIC